MMNEAITAGEAAEVFLRSIIKRGYRGTIESIMAILEKGPPGRKRSPDVAALHTWYEQLDSQARGNVAALVKETATEAIFGCLVVLDNASGGYPLEGQLSDFALQLQTYEDDEAQAENRARLSVRLNPASNQEDDLHDRFLLILRQSAP